MADIAGFDTASPGVVLDGVDAPLLSFVQHLALIHSLLFGMDLVITSGKDSIHSAGSLHAQGKAIDIRTKDKSPEQMQLLLAVLAFSAPDNQIAYFDERALAGQEHIHLEYHGA